MDSKNQDSIQVCIRVRPDNTEHSVLQFNEKQIQLDKNHFAFDHIFQPSCCQDDIFHHVGSKLISHTLQGYNACIFVYGQTGSGKTYTMIGDNNGIMQQSFVRLFQEIGSMEGAQCTINCSYYQIYNEQIIDLLDIRKDKDKKMNIRQDLKKGIYIQNMTEEAVFSVDKLFQCLSTGMRNRHVGETMMNRESSRSHSIFTINLSIKYGNEGAQSLKTPKLHFVDLAGSERQKLTAASGDRLKQAGNINKSLTSLGMVINALACEKNRSHIPYRDSKLTNLLRDSLGGNSKTFLIATVSRNVLCFQQTLSTLNFANRAKMVKVKALINQQSLSTNIQFYKDEIRRLKSQIMKLKSEKKVSSVNRQFIINHQAGLSTKVENYDSQFKEINEKISVISEHLIKNPTSPSLQALVQQIQTIKPTITDHRMEIEQQSGQEQDDEIKEDALIQYLSCNNSLLEKIHSKVDEYIELKQQLRKVAHNNTMTIAQLKTPSRFERDQYEQKIINKNTQIEAQQSQISALQTLLSKQQIQISEMKNQLTNHGGKIVQRDEEIQKFNSQRIQLIRQSGNYKHLLKQANEELCKYNRKYTESQRENKQNRQLYLYTQKSLQTQKALRKQIQTNLLNKMDEMQEIEKCYKFKLEEERQGFEQREEQLRDQLNILNQTNQFNLNLITKYTLEINEERQKIVEMETNKLQLEGVIAKYQQNEKNLNQSLKQQKQQIIMKQEQIQCLKNYTHTQKQQIQKLKQEKVKCQNEVIKKMEMLEMLGITNQQLTKQIVQLNCHLNYLTNQNQQKIQKLQQQYQILHSCKQQFQSKNKQLQCIVKQKQQQIQIIQQNYSKLQNCNINLNHNINQLKQQQKQDKIEYERKIEQIKYQMKTQMQKAEKICFQNQELKKAQKDILRENYKLKAKYGNNVNKTTDQLISKVNYYEEKFKLMSIEYQKALQAVKKMKQREIKQAQKISNLQESNKTLKIASQSFDEAMLSEELTKENGELKKQIESLKSQKALSKYNNMGQKENEKVCLKEKEEEMLKRVQKLIQRLDPSKQNICSEKNMEDLLNKWEELQNASDLKIEAISKGIKKEQKIKSQNKLVLKENIYLKEQVEELQKQLIERGSEPRKLIKKSSQPLHEIS